MKIKEIKIKGFRSIKDELYIKDFNNTLALIGRNNSGKSSIINALRLFFGENSCKETDFNIPLGNGKINIEILFDINLELSNLEKIYSNKFFDAPDRDSIKLNTIFNSHEISQLSGTELSSKFNILDGFNDNQKELILDKYKEKLISYFSINGNNEFVINFTIEKEKLFSFYGNKVQSGQSFKGDKDKLKEIMPKFLFIGDERKFNDEANGKNGSLISKLTSDLDIDNEEISLTNDRIRISDLRGKINDKYNEKAKIFGDKIAGYFKNYYNPDFDSVLIKGDVGDFTSKMSTTVKIKDPVLSEYININSVGAGLRSIYILSLLKTYNEEIKSQNSIICIEEPELYLHPELQKEMSETLKELSDDNTIIFSTHSTLLLKSFEVNNIKQVSFDEPNKTTAIKDGSIIEICKDLGFTPLDLLNKEIILFVEGTSDKEVFENIIRKYYNCIDKVGIIATGGCANMDMYANLNMFSLSPLLNNNTKFIIDRDYEGVSCDLNTTPNRLSSFKTKLQSVGFNSQQVSNYNAINSFITSGHSMENMFLNPTIIQDEFGITINDSVIKSEFETFINDSRYNKSDYEKEYNKIKKKVGLIEGISAGTISKEKIRGHNLMHFLVFKANSGDYSIFKDGTYSAKEKDFCNRYIQNSQVSDFQDLIVFFDRFDVFMNNKRPNQSVEIISG